MGAPAQGGQQVTPNQSGMFATGAPVAQGAIGGPSVTMANGASSGDVQTFGDFMMQAPAPSSGQNLASLMGGGGGPMPAGVSNPSMVQGQPQQLYDANMRPIAGAFSDPNVPNVSQQAPAGSGKGGGGAVGQPMPRPTQGQFAPLAPQGGFNVNQASAGALQQAMQGTQGAMQGPLAVSQFMNPYTQNVINRTQMDIMRQQKMAENQLGAQATAARAFGGSRQGVAEGVLAGEYGRMAGDIAAQQRQAGYTQALDAAMRDRAARAGYAQQLAGLGSQAFQTGQTIQQQQAQQGLLQQGLQQALIDAARQQYAGYVGSPAAALQAPLAALGVVPVPETTTKSKQPGFFDYATLAATAAAGM